MKEHRLFLKLRAKELAGGGGAAAAEATAPEAEAPAAAAAASAAAAPSGDPSTSSSVNAACSRVPAYDGAPLDDAAASERAAAEWRSLVEPELDSTKLEREAEGMDLTPAERAEKDSLIAAGFATWTRRDFRVFTAALEHHGRAARDAVVAAVAETTDKPAEEVGRYFEVFERRGPAELADWRKIEDRVAKGEEKIRRRAATEHLLADKVARSTDPYRTLSIAYGPNKGNTMKGFTEEEDRFLVCSLAKLGYGAWDALKLEVRTSETFRFDWFLKSRTSAELQRRCDTLVRLVEKEAAEAGGDGGGGA